MRKAKYVKKLEKMLDMYGNKICSHCPATRKFEPFILPVLSKTCKMCQGFIGLNYLHKGLGCPCYRMEPAEAIKCAREAIEKYKQAK